MELPKKNQKGFTLIELVVVIAVLAILLGITLVAINPAKQFSDARDTQRRSDVNAILNAVHQYAADPANGGYPAGIPDGDGGGVATNIGSAAGDVNICASLVTTFIAAIPADPQNGSYTDCASYSSGYNILETGGRITVSAPSAESGTISVTR